MYMYMYIYIYIYVKRAGSRARLTRLIKVAKVMRCVRSLYYTIVC